MNILYIDNNNFQSITRASLIEQLGKASIELCGSFESCLELYKNGHHDIVIIDFAIDDGAKILEYILSIDAYQKVITLSASNEISEIHGCEYCSKNHKKRRLMKPVPINDLINLIKDFDYYQCTHYKES